MSKRKLARRKTAPTADASKSTPSTLDSEACVISSSYRLEEHGYCVVSTVLSDAGGQNEIKRAFVMRIPPEVLIAKAVAFLVEQAVVESTRYGYKDRYIVFSHPDGTVGHTFSLCA
jgi:hypothetical protein